MKNITKKLRALKSRFTNYIILKQCGVAAEMEEGDHLVEVLGTIIIAVVILLLFRTKITAMFETMMSQTDTHLDSLFATPTPIIR